METIKFDPNVADLQAIVAATSKITADDLSNDVQLALVHDTRISLRDARVKIEKTGKALRADALKYQKDVIAREKELLGIILPEEDRLADIEHQANIIKERATRAALLPMRREQLAPFGEPTVTDESILDMDNDEFVTYLVQRQTQKNENDRLELETEKARLADEAHLAQVRKDAEVAERNRIEAAAKADEERRIQAEAQKKYDAELAAQKVLDDAKAEAVKVEEAARLEREAKAAAAQKLIDDAKAEADRVLREANDKIMQELAQKEAAEREAEIRERQVKEEASKKEAQQKFLLWAQGCGWDGAAGGYKTVHGAGGIELWKLVGTYIE